MSKPVNIAILTLGVFCCSTSVIFIKATSQPALILTAWRLILASLLLTPLMLRAQKTCPDVPLRSRYRAALIPGLMLAAHLATWAVGAKMTPAANATLIANMVPIVMPILLVWVTRERLSRAEAVGTAVALSGFFLLVANDFNISRDYFWGDAVCFGSMLFFAAYLVLARKNRAADQLWLYVVPLYSIAALTCTVLCFFFANPVRSYSVHDMLMMSALGVIPTVCGHSILNRSMHVLRGQIVSVFTMGQFIFAGTMAWWFFKEVPAPLFYLASAMFIIGGWIVAFRGGHAPDSPDAATRPEALLD